MRVLSLPFSVNNGIQKSSKDEFLLQLNYSPNITNHIGIVHASALFALAETTSGYFLELNFAKIANQTIPILRSSQVMYRRQGEGICYANAQLKNTTIAEVTSILVLKKKILFEIDVTIFNEQNELLMKGIFNWYVTLKT